MPQQDTERRSAAGPLLRRRSPSPTRPFVLQTVHFSVLYRLHQPTLSITQQGRGELSRTATPTLAAAAAAAAPSSPEASLPALARVMWRERVGRRGMQAQGSLQHQHPPGADASATHGDTTVTTNDSNFIRTYKGSWRYRPSASPPPPSPAHALNESGGGGGYRSPFQGPSPLSTSAAAARGSVTSDWERSNRTTAKPSPSPPQTAPSFPLSTFDLRELSKVVLRDALFAQLLDLVPARTAIQCAVWHVGPERLQMDGAVLCIGSRGRLGRGARKAAERALVDRVTFVAHDPVFFASVLRPYLGEEGSLGAVESVQVNATGAYE